MKQSLEAIVTTKAYDNKDFLHARNTRPIRILAEYMETEARLKRHEVYGSILFFGSARALSKAKYERRLKVAEDACNAANKDERIAAEKNLKKIQNLKKLCSTYEKVEELAAKITEWAQSEAGQSSTRRIFQHVASDTRRRHDQTEPFLASQTMSDEEEEESRPPMTAGDVPLVICTGGGPGMMEAANRGAFSSGGRSMGMGISLPFESGCNPYVTPDLAFEYHYFFSRKFWMTYMCCGVVVAPGGFGTIDEMMEILTLKQTGKIRREIPMVLFNSEFWNKVISFETLKDFGVINEEDYSHLLITDDVNEAFYFLIRGMMKESAVIRTKSVKITRTFE